MLTQEELDKLQVLARLRLAEEETALFLDQLQRILQYIEKLEELDLADVLPLTYPGSPRTPLREDRACEGLGRDRALSGAPETSGGLFKVPPVMRGRRP